MNKHKWWILLLGVLATFLTSLDMTAVNLILSPLSVDLKIAVDNLPWLLNGYILIYAAFIVAGGRMGDIYGAKNILLSGTLFFLLGSLVAAFSQTFFTILVARLIQGFGAAFLLPNASAIIYRVFPEEQKGLVTGIFTSTLAGAISLGPLIGGILTKLQSWRLVFLVNVPLCLVLFLLIVIFTKTEKKENASLRSIDLPGVILLGVFLFSVVAIFDFISDLKTYPILFYGSILIAFCSFILFVMIERHTEKPMIRVELLTNRIINYSCIIRFFYGIPPTTLMFIMALYMQQTLQLNPIEAGVMFLPVTLSILFISPFVGKWVDTIGTIIPLNLGTLLSTIGFIGLVIPKANVMIWSLVISFIFAGIGTGMMRPPLVTAIMKATPPEDLGLVNSIFNMLNSIGGAVGVAISGAFLALFTQYKSSIALAKAMPLAMYFCIASFILIAFLVKIGLKPTQ